MSSESKTASKIHIKVLIKSLGEFFTNIRKLKEEEKRFKRTFYSSMKEEVEHIMNHYLLNEGTAEDELKKGIDKVKRIWEEIEREIMGVLIIITKDPIYFWKKNKIWKNRRKVLLAEDIEEAIELCMKIKSLDTNPFGKPINAIIVDPTVVEKLDDLQRLKELMEKEKFVGDILVE